MRKLALLIAALSLPAIVNATPTLTFEQNCSHPQHKYQYIVNGSPPDAGDVITYHYTLVGGEYLYKGSATGHWSTALLTSVVDKYWISFSCATEVDPIQPNGLFGVCTASNQLTLPMIGESCSHGCSGGGAGGWNFVLPYGDLDNMSALWIFGSVAGL